LYDLVPQRVLLDASLGFAAGVMLAASYWSLLAPGIEMAEQSGSYGENGEFAFVPAAIGFFLGAAFVYAADLVMDRIGVHSPVELGKWLPLSICINLFLF
jgi:zinc transporter 11